MSQVDVSSCACITLKISENALLVELGKLNIRSDT